MNMASGTEHGDENAELLNSEEVARILRVKPDTLRQWRHKNRGPAYTRVERFVRYSRADLDAYIARNRNTTHDDHPPAVNAPTPAGGRPPTS